MIIGLLGPAGSGKTTVAKYLARAYGFERRSLAAPLKEIARLTLGFTDQQVYGTQEQKDAIDPRYGFSPRWFLQRLGTEGIRGVFGASFWVDYALNYAPLPPLTVFDDLRFINEATLFRTRASIWRLECPDHTFESSHASETEWQRAPFDRVLRASYGDVDSLKAQVDDIMENL